MTEDHTKEVTEVATNGGGYDDLTTEAQQWLYDKYFDEMPYGIAKARTGDPSQWLDENAMPDFVEKSYLYYLPGEDDPQGPKTPQLRGETDITGKWLSNRDIQKAEMMMDEAKGN